MRGQLRSLRAPGFRQSTRLCARLLGPCFETGPCRPVRPFGLKSERLVPLQFQALLTFFPKFFSTFPRGTCSLSVSRAYLALDGVYHLLHATISCSATLITRSLLLAGPAIGSSTGLSPFLAAASTAFRCHSRAIANATPGLRPFGLGSSSSLAATGGILVSFCSSAY